MGSAAQHREGQETNEAGLELVADNQDTANVEEPEVFKSEELDYMRRHYWLSLILSIPVVLISVVKYMALIPESMTASTLNWTQLVLVTPVFFWGSMPFISKAWVALKHGRTNMFTLVVIGASVSYIFSVFVTASPEVFAKLSIAGGLSVTYFDTTALIVTLVLLGQVLELKAKQQTSHSIQNLVSLTPSQVRVLHSNGEERDKSIDHIGIGTKIRVRPGEKVPVDGTILEGTTDIDEAMITGESVPASKSVGETVTGGTVNLGSTIIVRTDRVGKDTTLSKIVNMVQKSNSSQSDVQKNIERFIHVFIPAVILISVAVFCAWSLYGPEPSFVHAWVCAVSVLIIACPCALGLAAPMSIMIGCTRGAMSGVLVKEARAFEALAAVDSLVIDKTGTLSEGRPKVVNYMCYNDFDEHDFLRYCASLEAASEHALADAVVEFAKEVGVEMTKTKNIRVESGKGLQGDIEGRNVAIGNGKFMADLEVDRSESKDVEELWFEKGYTISYVAVDGELAGLLAMVDPIKKSSPALIASLEEKDVRVIMLTGDTHHAARAAAAELGIEEFKAGVLPQDKVAAIEELQARGRMVAMAGDGVNDAPALSQANVGIAMGTGSDVAIENAEVTLMKGEIENLGRAFDLGKVVMTNVKQNIVFAFIYNLVAMPLAAGVFYPWTKITLSPMIATITMAFGSFIVIANSLRLNKVEL